MNYSKPTLHIIGAGLAGLAAALKGSHTHRVILYESAAQAGGRCRSFYDKTLETDLDNGSHLILGAYKNTLEYLREIGADDTLTTLSPATFPFIDLRSGDRWHLQMNRGFIPYWLFDASRRVPRSKPGDYVKDLNRIRQARSNQTVDQAFYGYDSPLFESLWRPLTLSILNTDTDQASAKVLWSALVRTLVKGEKACRPLLPKNTLKETFVDPALNLFQERRIPLHYNKVLKKLKFEGDLISQLVFSKEKVEVAPDDSVILAVPAKQSAALLPDIPTPKDHNSIVGVHFKVPNNQKPLGEAALLGVVGGRSQWIFHRSGMLSVTISNSDKITKKTEAGFIQEVWREIGQATGDKKSPIPPHRIIREKRATIAQTPTQDACRPDTATPYRNLFLAGDWTNTGLPATIEGAVLSGFKAVKLIKKS